MGVASVLAIILQGKWYCPRFYRCGTRGLEKLYVLRMVPPVSDAEPDVFPCVMWPPMMGKTIV